MFLPKNGGTCLFVLVLTVFIIDYIFMYIHNKRL